MALGRLQTEGDLERFLEDRLEPFDLKIRQLQDPAYGGFAGEFTGDGVATAFTVDHGLGTFDVHVTCYDDVSKTDIVEAIDRPSVDQARVTFAVAPALGLVFRIVVSR